MNYTFRFCLLARYLQCQHLSPLRRVITLLH